MSEGLPVEVSGLERTLGPVLSWLLVEQPAGRLLGQMARLAARLDDLPDEELVELSHLARRAGQRAYLLHCLALALFRRRWEESDPHWAERAALLCELSPVTVRRDARVGTDVLVWAQEAEPWALEALEAASAKQLKVLAWQELRDRKEALTALCRYVAETGDREAEGFVGRLRAEGLLARPPGYRYVCPACGHEGRLRDFRRPRDEREEETSHA